MEEESQEEAESEIPQFIAHVPVPSQKEVRLSFWDSATVKLLKIWISKQIAVIILKLNQCIFTTESCIQKMLTE